MHPTSNWTCQKLIRQNCAWFWMADLDPLRWHTTQSEIRAQSHVWMCTSQSMNSIKSLHQTSNWTWQNLTKDRTQSEIHAQSHVWTRVAKLAATGCSLSSAQFGTKSQKIKLLAAAAGRQAQNSGRVSLLIGGLDFAPDSNQTFCLASICLHKLNEANDFRPCANLLKSFWMRQKWWFWFVRNHVKLKSKWSVWSDLTNQLTIICQSVDYNMSISWR